jgi:signal transduction histidine kinase/uncharacterized protein HemY
MISARFILSIFFCAIISFSFSQNNSVEELQQKLLKASDDTTKVNLLNKLSYALRSKKKNQAFNYAQEALKISQEKDFQKGIGLSYKNLGIVSFYKKRYSQSEEFFFKAITIFKTIDEEKELSKCYNNLGLLYKRQAKYQESINNFQKSLQILEKFGDKREIAEKLNNLGNIHKALANNAKSLEYYTRSLNIREEINDKKGVADSYTNIGLIYYYRNNPKNAAKFHLKSLEINKKSGDERRMANNYINLGLVYLYDKDYKNAIEYFRKSLNLKEKFNDRRGMSKCYLNLGLVYDKLKDFKKAKQSFEKSLEISKKLEYKNGISACCNYLGKMNINQGNYEKAIKYCQEGLKIAKEINSKTNIRRAYEYLSECYAKLNNYKKAYEHHILYREIYDTIFKQENIKKIAEMQIKYETEKKEQENVILRKEKKIQQLAFDKQITLRNSFIAFSILVITLVIFIFSRYRIKKKANVVLSEKNDIITLQKNQLVDTLDELKEANATKDKFFSIIAHDLKIPFNVILGYTELLQTDYDDFTENERKSFIVEINKASQSTYNLLENLLTWARSQQRKIVIVKEKLNLNLKELINKSVEPYKNNAKKKNISIINKVLDDIFIWADVYTFSTVIGNLTNNAIKFTHPEGVITISASEKNESVEICVSDNGVGIEQEVINKLFRIDESYSTKGTNNETGTGLGLILCEEFVEKNGGKITVRSQVGKGSDFVVTLPANHSEKENTEE